MRLSAISAALTLFLAGAFALDKPLDIEVLRKVECENPTKKGDKIEVHYRGTLEKDGTEFDASYNRGQPLGLTLGSGQVIRGWDEGLIGMCNGAKWKLTIQPEWGYGKRGMGPIPANSVLVFETELVSHNGKEALPAILGKAKPGDEL